MLEKYSKELFIFLLISSILIVYNFGLTRITRVEASIVKEGTLLSSYEDYKFFQEFITRKNVDGDIAITAKEGVDILNYSMAVKLPVYHNGSVATGADIMGIIRAIEFKESPIILSIQTNARGEITRVNID